MTRKKPPIAAKKRPAAEPRKPVKTAAATAEKAVAPVATAREKERPKPAPARKPPEEPVIAPYHKLLKLHGRLSVLLSMVRTAVGRVLPRRSLLWVSSAVRP